MAVIRKLLIANRGEIAARIIRTCRTMNIATVAVFSDADSHSRYLEMADQAVYIGSAPSTESYLNQHNIFHAAKKTEADAIHPGYGFLSENPELARNCAKTGFLFVGPPAKAMAIMASKIKARQLVRELDIPVIPGYDGASQTLDDFKKAAADIGYPVLLKAAAGGGGIGIRVIGTAEELDQVFVTAGQEALSGFGDETLLLEKYLPKVRHVEVQVASDHYGNAIHLFERECSVQRRRQKVIEESPAPHLEESLRRKLCQAAVEIARSVKYSGVGTVEFVLETSEASEPAFYFLEMNTRLQVEHGITEQVTGLDLVRLQIEIAEGKTLPFSQEQIAIQGHSIECRLYAEDPLRNFHPMTGRVLHWRPPRLPNVRIEEAVTSGGEVTVFYDPLLAKIIATGKSREAAIRTMDKALSDLVPLGPVTNQNFLRAVIRHPLYQAGKADTQFAESRLEELNQQTQPVLEKLAAAVTVWLAENDRSPGADRDWKGGYHLTHALEIEMNDETVPIVYKTFGRNNFHINVGESHIGLEMISLQPIDETGPTVGVGELVAQIDGVRERFVIAQEDDTLFVHSRTAGTHRVRRLMRNETDHGTADRTHRSTMAARVMEILVAPGQTVETGQQLVVLESMKMQTVVIARYAGKVAEILCEKDQLIESGTELLIVE
ncbi:MAG: ATP-grasp domain-containing protein [Proteobacteria bacterium]|nr:ATP-grasp domain-containing protein [Pseudomonadota bacterium]